MKSHQQIFAAALLTVFAFCTVLYSSCNKNRPDPCSGISCLNGGACNEGICICPTGFEGRFCETTTDPCKNVVCQNGGTCDDGSCICPTGFSGVNCEVKWRDKFVGTYVGTEACKVGGDNYAIALASAFSGLQLNMSNLYNNNYTATCTMTAENSFSFTGSDGTVSYSGTGSMAGSTLSITYTVTNGSISNSCTYTGTK